MNYEIQVDWDPNLIDVWYTDIDNPLVKGLVKSGVYIATGAPAATSGKFIPGCLILNAASGIVYQNVGSSAAPVWAELSTEAPSTNTISVNTAGLRISGGSASALAQAHIGFNVTVKDTAGVPIAADTNMASLGGGNLAFDNGAQPPTTNSCRMYTFLVDVNTTTGATTLSVINGPDFPKHRPMHPSTDVNFGDGTKAIIGFLYVKNESNAVFVPNTTHLDASGITASFSTEN